MKKRNREATMAQRNRFLDQIKEKLDQMQEEKLEAKLEIVQEENEHMSKSNRDEYVQQMKDKLDGINAEIASLESKAAEAGEKVKDKFESRIEKLEMAATEGQERLKEIKGAAHGTWEGLKAGMDTLVHNIGSTIEETKKAFHEAQDYK
jgi:L-lactate utilization protein LutC